jgi:hypothetical protein
VGAYYTPAEVVHAQITLARILLERELGKPRGFADDEVTVLDPACGTGIYPCAIVAETLKRSPNPPALWRPLDRGATGARARWATALARNIVACELDPGAAAVARGRLQRLLLDAGGALPAGGAQVFAADTLAAPPPAALAGSGVRCCIGNPPYARGSARTEDLLGDFLPSGRAAAGTHVKNLYNQYVYFWRWALRWALEEPRSTQGGVVAFVTAASYLRGPGFAAMRRQLRRLADEIWILDLGGEGRGPRRSDNVFPVTVPVAIAFALRRGGPATPTAAPVWYTALPDGAPRAEKLRLLGALSGFEDLAWQPAPRGWDAPFAPAASGAYGRWPRLTDLFPWQHSGAQWKRTWPVGETRELLARRWRALVTAPDRQAAFGETRDRTVDRPARALLDEGSLPALAGLPRATPPPAIVRYAWRSLDRRYCLLDGRLGDFLRPTLWRTRGPRQIFLTSLLTGPLGAGPALMATAEVPDLHCFRGSFGGKDVIPLWRDADATGANVAGGLLDRLADDLGRPVTPEDLLAYAYALMAHPGYTARFAEALAEPGPRLPLTRRPALFTEAAALGRALIACHTYGARLRPAGWRLSGAARCRVPIPPGRPPADFAYAADRQELRVGGGVLAPVPPAVWDYQVSGLAVVRSWLGYRLLRPRGRRSSPLDDLRPARWTAGLTRELCELLWVLERSLALHDRQGALLERVLAGPLYAAADLFR